MTAVGQCFYVKSRYEFTSLLWLTVNMVSSGQTIFTVSVFPPWSHMDLSHSSFDKPLS